MGRFRPKDGRPAIRKMDEWRTVGDVYERFDGENKVEWFTLYLETRLSDPNPKTNIPDLKLAQMQLTQDNVCQKCHRKGLSNIQKMTNCNHYFHKDCAGDPESCQLCSVGKQ